MCAAPDASRAPRAGHVPRAARATRSSPSPPRATGVRVGQHRCALLPTHHKRSEQGTSPCRSLYAAVPLPATGDGGQRRLAQVCAAPDASRAQRAGHVPVPLALRDRPSFPPRALGVHVGPHTCVLLPSQPPDASRAQRAGSFPCRSRHAIIPLPATSDGDPRRATQVYAAPDESRAQRAGHSFAARAPRTSPSPSRATGGPRRAAQVLAAPDAPPAQRAGHLPAPLALRDHPPSRLGRRGPRRAAQLPTNRERSEPGTSPCRSRSATVPLPAPGGGGPRLTAQVCAAPDASRAQRAGHVPLPLALRDRPSFPPRAAGVRVEPHKCVLLPTRRERSEPARSRAARATRSSPSPPRAAVIRVGKHRYRTLTPTRSPDGVAGTPCDAGVGSGTAL